MSLIDHLDRTFFQSCLDEVFRVDDGPVELKLIECTGLTSHAGEFREPFSLLFRGPVEPVLAQKIYTLHNERTGPLDIFLVPVERDAAGLKYQAVFN